ncbi:MAG: hypothetical protein M3120_00215 [Pseudomonadota bacterium]|nr:hypothetical protein [Pseudomonadota bacterium]
MSLRRHVTPAVERMVQTLKDISDGAVATAIHESQVARRERKEKARLQDWSHQRDSYCVYHLPRHEADEARIKPEQIFTSMIQATHLKTK